MVTEMTQAELAQFRNEWIEDYYQSLIFECGWEDGASTREIAEIRFETYMGQEGYTARDLMIAEQRFVA